MRNSNPADKDKRRRGTGRIYKQSGCTLWTIQYYRNGKRLREATGTADYQIARQKLNQRLAQVSTGVFVGPQVERIRIADLWEPMERDHRINGKGLEHATRRWKKHLEPFFGALRAAEVGTDVLNQYVDARMIETAKNATINREIAVLRRMFRLAYYSKPQKVITLPKFPRLEEDNVRLGFIEPQQYSAIAAAASELWMRAIVEIYHTYGWRKREVINMRVRQADISIGVIRLDVGSTKNKEGREVTMTASIKALLIECARNKNADDFLFTRTDGKRVLDFRKAWRNLCKEAKVPGLMVHDMRRTAARNLRRAGVAEGVIMRIGGWKTRSIFERYNIVDQKDIRDALCSLEKAREVEFSHNLGHNAPDEAAVAPVAKRPRVN